MPREFLLGCNYWASHAGTDMWRRWDPTVVREDLQILTAHGVSCMRVFPNWRDFQPIAPFVDSHAHLREYRTEQGDRLTSPDWLDPIMVEHFSDFCDLCDEFGVRLIVGLITGFMSGQTHIPSALYGKNLLTDPVALLFQQRFIHRFVSRFRDRRTIYAWDLGNECNNLAPTVSEEEATAWSLTVANAIRAADPSRPVVSGMHGLVASREQGHWTIRGQAEACDVLTTHPYPYFVPYAGHDPIASMRTALHATCETKLYGDIGNRPCLVEEIGTLGPMICSDENAAAFLRVNLWSNWIHGASGVLWWCANEQSGLTHTPYTTQMCELELGMRYADGSPKPVLTELGRFADQLRSLPFELPPCREDAVCISTFDQRQWGVAYMTTCLAKQSGLTLRYMSPDQPLPPSDLYLMPSVSGASVLPRETYLELQRRVQNGATLYVSIDNAFLAEFQPLTGLKIVDSCAGDSGTVALGKNTIRFTREREFRVTPTTAEVLATDDHGNPAVTVNRFGKGRVIVVNFPLEAMLLNVREFPKKNYYQLYRTVFADHLARKAIVTANPFVGLTLHPDADGNILCAAVNYSDTAQTPSFSLRHGYAIRKNLYGSPQEIPAFDACIFRIGLNP